MIDLFLIGVFIDQSHRRTELDRPRQFGRVNDIGGLLRYGIPNFKMEKGIIDRRVAILEAEGITFKVNVNVGVNYDVEDLKAFDEIG